MPTNTSNVAPKVPLPPTSKVRSSSTTLPVPGLTGVNSKSNALSVEKISYLHQENG